MNRSVLIESHQSNGTCLAFSSKSQQWFLGNNVGEVDPLFTSGESISLNNCENIQSISINSTGDLLAICHDKIVSLYDGDWTEKNGFFCRTTLPITHSEFDSTGQHLFISSQEPDIKIYSLATESLETSIKSLDDAVKTFALHPTGDYLALINGKGDLLIYRLVSEKGPLGKHYIGSNLVLNQNVSSKLSSRDFEEGFRISWRNSSGNSPLQLCIPQHDGFPMIFTRHSPASAANSNDNEADSSSSTRNETWDDNTILTSDAYEQTLSHCREYVNLVCFSPNGKYLASADRTGKVLIWDIPTKDAITSYQCHDLAEIPQQLLDLQWGSCDGDNYLIVLSQVGVAKINNVINTTLGHPLPTGEYSEVPLTPPPLPVAKAPAAAVPSLQSHSAHKRIKKSVGFGADEKDDDDDFDFTETLQKSSTLQSDLSPTPSSSAFKGTVIQDEDDDETNSLPAPPPPAAAAVPTAAVTSAGAARGRSAAGKAVPTARSLTETEAYEDDDDLSDDLEGVDLVTDGMDEFLVDDPHHPHRFKKNNKTLSLSSLSSLLFHQAPFQSSSTTYDERRRRYLVWNSVGSMITRDEDIGNRIEIKFADNSSGSYHKNEHFNDNYGFELGDLSAHGALFATLPEEQIEPSMTPSGAGAGAGAGGGGGGVGLGVEDEEDEDLMTTGGGLTMNKTKRTGSILFYKSFYSKIETGYFANENFTHSFPYHEVVRCVTTSLGWCAVVTSTNSLFYLRIFSTAGIQLHLSLLKGAVVTMCSSLHNLAIIYNSSTMVSKSSPYLLVDLYYITPITRSCDSSSSSSSSSSSGTSSGSGVTGSPLPNLTCLLSQCILPLSAMSSLQWISFSNNSQLVSLDTSGQLLMLFTFSSCASSSTTSQWIPVMDTNQLKKNLIDYHLYPITVKTDKLCYVLLNGQKRPSIHPQPVVTAKSFSLPVLELKEKDHGGVSRSSGGGAGGGGGGGAGGGGGGGGAGGGGVNGTDRIRDALWLSLSLTHHQHTLESHLLSGYPLPYLTPVTSSGSRSSSSNLETCSLDEVVSQELIGMDKLLLKLFYECCKKQRVAMALDVMGRMVTTDALESAIKVANHFSKASLAMILSEILNEKRRGEDKTHERDSRSLEREFESEVHSHSHSNSYSHSNRRTSASASASASVVSGGGRPGIASFSASSQQQGQGKGREEEESQFQLAQSSYVSSSQSYEYAPSSQAQEVVEEEEEEDGFLSHRHSSSSVLSKKPLITQAPLFSSSSPSPTAAPGSEERPKTIPVNKFAQSQMSSPSKKKRSIHESLAQDLKGSPSPKKATLSRESSFSKEARSKRFHDKKIL